MFHGYKGTIFYLENLENSVKMGELFINHPNCQQFVEHSKNAKINILNQEIIIPNFKKCLKNEGEKKCGHVVPT